MEPGEVRFKQGVTFVVLVTLILIPAANIPELRAQEEEPGVFLRECLDKEFKPIKQKQFSLWELSECRFFDPPVKFEIEATFFSIGDPVHQTITILAYDQLTDKNDKELNQIIRGVIWNDDPCADLFVDTVNKALKPSSGWAWYSDFRAAENNNFTSLNCDLLAESHFGSFQFLHAMATRDCEAIDDTLDKILAWAELSYRVAVKKIGIKTIISDTGINRIASTTGKFNQKTLLQVFTKRSSKLAKLRSDTWQNRVIPLRAMGSLLHMIQDSFAGGHTFRAADNSIIQFYSYRGQDHGKHSEDDRWVEASSDQDRVERTPGVKDAIAATSRLLQFYRSKASWQEVKSYLTSDLFKLNSKTFPAGPGGDYTIAKNNAEYKKNCS